MTRPCRKSPRLDNAAEGQSRPYGVTSADVERLRTRTLVPHGVKCTAGCGSTLVPADPLPHVCNPRESRDTSEFWRYLG